MAKKKVPTKTTVSRARASAINFRAMPEWKAWIDEFAEFDRCTLVELIDRALVAYAREKKFSKAAPRR
jgi:hypothetical protein